MNALSASQIIIGAIQVVSTISFAISAYFSFLFIYKAKWALFSWVKLWIGTASILSSAVNIHYIVKLLSGIPIINDLVEAMLVRLVMMLVGLALAASSIVRYSTLQHGGEQWTMRK